MSVALLDILTTDILTTVAKLYFS